MFAKAYNPSTAATDPGLPLVTSISVSDKAPGQIVSKGYNLINIISDVKTAINALPASNINRYRVTKYAAYGLLARVYLYMADYSNAEKYADSALMAPEL